LDDRFSRQLALKKDALQLHDLYSEWLKDCDQNHLCNDESEFWPTRVIFIGGPDPAKLRLIETKSELSMLKGERYVALSHCWGGPTQGEKLCFCTVSQNYYERLHGFRLGSLPHTFQDAVHVTRAIGKKFLWIDALAIIQEDARDWEAEAGSMERVFSAAYCTIAADSAADWKQGFLHRERPPQYYRDTKFYLTTREWIYKCSSKDDFEKDVNGSNLNKRAWVLQERVLSRRMLHFTKNHTYFACGDSVRCENFMKLKV
jgi:Heterokaryon incompatibility protein (HET)